MHSKCFDMRKILICGLFLALASVASAQPQKRRTTTNEVMKQQQQKKIAASDRASLMFPTKDAMPADAVWRRDIYRTLDLSKDANAPLYYPVEPMGRQVNLFTYVFRLMLTGRINAYTYKLDGVESFDAKDKMEIRDVLDRYSIYYEEKENGKFTVENNDIPSAEVTRYYIKESVYIDQRTGAFQTKVTALCPVLMRGADDFGGDATPYPLFWLNYDDVAPWLAKLPVMASNLNNVTNMTADDYFNLNRYEGKIYKTNNMQGKALAHYCKTDSAMTAEQKRIEKEIVDFEGHVWGHMNHEDSVKAAVRDSIKNANTPVKRSSLTRSTRTSSSAVVSARRTSGAAQTKSSGTSAAPVSARRQRR